MNLFNKCGSFSDPDPQTLINTTGTGMIPYTVIDTGTGTGTGTVPTGIYK
jgi:hypothetical protein